jgi:hypothetical protein
MAAIDPAVLLSDAPSFVVGRIGGAGLVCRLYRADPCCGGEREFGLEARPARLNGAGHAAPTGEPPLDLRIGVDCGFIYYAEGGLADPAKVPILEHLDLALDGRILDALARRWLSERGQTDRAGQRQTEKPDWQPGRPLVYEEVFQVLRQDNFHGPLGCYAALDLYFIDPEDDSHEVIVHFGESVHAPTREVGGVRVDLTSGKVEMMPEHASSKMLRYLWSRYRRRYPDLSHLAARYAQMREVGVELSTTGNPSSSPRRSGPSPT